MGSEATSFRWDDGGQLSIGAARALGGWLGILCRSGVVPHLF